METIGNEQIIKIIKPNKLIFLDLINNHGPEEREIILKSNFDYLIFCLNIFILIRCIQRSISVPTQLNIYVKTVCKKSAKTMLVVLDDSLLSNN